jgi:hypothetical protein
MAQWNNGGTEEGWKEGKHMHTGVTLLNPHEGRVSSARPNKWHSVITLVHDICPITVQYSPVSSVLDNASCNSVESNIPWALGPIQPPIQWIPGAVSPGGKVAAE